MSAVDWPSNLGEIYRVLDGDGDREQKASGIVRAIRRAGGYRWVGLYEVGEEEIANLAFDGPGAPAHPRFPVTQGLSGASSLRRLLVHGGLPPPAGSIEPRAFYGGELVATRRRQERSTE